MWLTEAVRPRKFWRGKMRQPTFFTPDKIFRVGAKPEGSQEPERLIPVILPD